MEHTKEKEIPTTGPDGRLRIYCYLLVTSMLLGIMLLVVCTLLAVRMQVP